MQLISASLTTEFPIGTTPEEIVFIPEGKSTITPYVDGKPKRITIDLPAEKGQMIAAKLQADLEKRQGNNVRPWIDFDHKGGKSAGNPKSFRYEQGKGVILAMDWSNAGKQAIEGKDYSYFSPSFLVDNKGIPSGLDSTGTIGGLVNEPAFRNIQRIAAKDGSTTNTKNIMSQVIFAKLGIDPESENAEQSAVDKIEAMNGDMSKLKEMDEKIEAMKKERDEYKKKYETVGASQAESRKERAKSLVEAAKADGRIAPKDEETANAFFEKIEAGDSFAETMLNKLPKLSPEGTIINASHQKGESTESRIDAALGKARAELGDTAPFASIWDRARDMDEQAFK